MRSWQRRQEEAEEAAAPPKEAEEGYSGILRNIRRANDRIADPVLSAKIDRLEEVTAKIFQAVEADPKKRSSIDTFLNYYLPTTQKLLDSYAEFEATGVEGANLGQAKDRIEKTMDSIVAGFRAPAGRALQDGCHERGQRHPGDGDHAPPGYRQRGEGLRSGDGARRARQAQNPGRGPGRHGCPAAGGVSRERKERDRLPQRQAVPFWRFCGKVGKGRGSVAFLTFRVGCLLPEDGDAATMTATTKGRAAWWRETPGNVRSAGTDGSREGSFPADVSVRVRETTPAGGRRERIGTMSVSTTLKRVGLEQAFHYLYKDPEKNLRHIMDWADKFANGEFERQRATIRAAIEDPKHPYHDYILHVVNDVDPEVMKTMAANFFLNANLIGWDRQESIPQAVQLQHPLGHPAGPHLRLQPPLHRLLGGGVRQQAEPEL